MHGVAGDISPFQSEKGATSIGPVQSQKIVNEAKSVPSHAALDVSIFLS
jgi:hypothetical protein